MPDGPIRVHTVIINATGKYQTWNDLEYDSFEAIGEAYKEMRARYGRCRSKVYRDTKDGTKAIGWVFEKREKYTDCDEYYLQEAWCEPVYHTPAKLTPVGIGGTA